MKMQSGWTYLTIWIIFFFFSFCFSVNCFWWGVHRAHTLTRSLSVDFNEIENTRSKLRLYITLITIHGSFFLRVDFSYPWLKREKNLWIFHTLITIAIAAAIFIPIYRLIPKIITRHNFFFFFFLFDEQWHVLNMSHITWVYTEFCVVFFSTVLTDTRRYGMVIKTYFTALLLFTYVLL